MRGADPRLSPSVPSRDGHAGLARAARGSPAPPRAAPAQTPRPAAVRARVRSAGAGACLARNAALGSALPRGPARSRRAPGCQTGLRAGPAKVRPGLGGRGAAPGPLCAGAHLSPRPRRPQAARRTWGGGPGPRGLCAAR